MLFFILEVINNMRNVYYRIYAQMIWSLYLILSDCYIINEALQHLFRWILSSMMVIVHSWISRSSERDSCVIVGRSHAEISAHRSPIMIVVLLGIYEFVLENCELVPQFRPVSPKFPTYSSLIILPVKLHVRYGLLTVSLSKKEV
jgi:hypothetical protein